MQERIPIPSVSVCGCWNWSAEFKLTSNPKQEKGVRKLKQQYMNGAQHLTLANNRVHPKRNVHRWGEKILTAA